MASTISLAEVNEAVASLVAAKAQAKVEGRAGNRLVVAEYKATAQQVANFRRAWKAQEEAAGRRLVLDDGRPSMIGGDAKRTSDWGPRAISASGLFLPTWRDILDASQLAIDLDAETHKVALYSNSLTPNFSSNTGYGVSPLDANEVIGTGWSAGGVALTGTTFTESPTGSLMWDATDVTASTTTITNARGALAYADASAGNEALLLINFGADYSTVAGTFTIQFASGGLWSWDLTP